MGDLEPVLEAILNGAKTREAAIYDDSKRRINMMNLEFEKEKESLKRRLESELDEETDKIYESGRAKDRQLIKNAEIKAKSDFILSVIASAKEYIYRLEPEKYSDFLKEVYKDCVDEKGCIIYLSEEDKKRVRRGTFETCEISDKTISSGGGFVAVCENVSYDFTLDSIFEEKYDEVCDNVSALLRGESL